MSYEWILGAKIPLIKGISCRLKSQDKFARGIAFETGLKNT